VTINNRDFDVIVIGLGAIGSAAAYWLARRNGTRVLALEQFELGHARGASQDHSRIIRLSYHTPRHVRLAKRAYEAWEQVERESGEQLLVRTGGLDLFPPDAAIASEDYTGSMDQCGVPFERLNTAELTDRYPQWHLDDGTRGLFQPDGGLVAAAAANEAHRGLAQEHGAMLREHVLVVAIEPRGGEADVLTEDGSFRCRKVVLATDAWVNELLEPLGTRIPMTVTQEQVTYFANPHPEAFAPERFPIWIWMDDPCFYGFPAFGERGPKVGQDVGGDVVTARSRTFDPNPTTRARVLAFMSRHLPGAIGPELVTKTCLYAMPPDREFVLDAVPGHPEVLVALGAAQGFKFASLFGRIMADLAVDGMTDEDLSAFAFDRPVLSIADPPRTFLF